MIFLSNGFNTISNTQGTKTVSVPNNMNANIVIEYNIKELTEAIDMVFSGSPEEYKIFKKGLPQPTQEEILHAKNVFMSFVKNLEDDANVQKLVNSVKFTKQGTVTQKSMILSLPEYEPLCYQGTYGTLSVIYLTLLPLLPHGNSQDILLHIGTKNCAITKLPWDKQNKAVGIKAIDTIPMSYYKDNYGKKFLYLGLYLEEDTLTKNEQKTRIFVRHTYLSESYYKKYQLDSDLSQMFKDTLHLDFKHCNILAKPKNFVSTEGAESRPIGNCTWHSPRGDLTILIPNKTLFNNVLTQLLPYKREDWLYDVDTNIWIQIQKQLEIQC